MKRYLLFQFDDYYPAGGWNDLDGDYDSIASAMTARASNQRGDNYQVVDTQTNQVVETNARNIWGQPRG